ncbi:3'-5' exonuclease [bacterium]|nr:3'-5' exonuclease [bacterium]
MVHTERFSIVDTETTGLRASDNKIIEIAIINMNGSQIVEKFETLINPQRRITPLISKITGIDNQMLLQAPPFFKVAKKIIEMTQDRVFVAHNARFDFDFLQHEFSELGYNYQAQTHCTVRLARKAFPKETSYSLPKLTASLGISHGKKHRAMGDALATAELFKRIQSSLTQEIKGDQTLAPF